MIKKNVLILLFLIFCSINIFSQTAGTVLEEISDNAEILKKQAEEKESSNKDGQTVISEEKKVALIMGNSGQNESGMSRYVMDALSMSALLAENNFSVKVTLEGTQKQLLDSLKEYSRNIKNADASFLYFAGEMTCFDGVNYLIPVGSEIVSYDELTYKAVSLDDILSTVAKAGCKKNLFVFDAGFISMNKEDTSYLPQTVSVQKFKMESYIAISAADSNKKDTSKGQHTPFTSALMTQLASSESSIDEVIKMASSGITSISLLTDSTLSSGYYLKNTSAYVTENVKTEVVKEVVTEVIEKEKVTTIFADDLVEGNLRRIAVSSYSDGQLFYKSKDGKEIILGNLIKDTQQGYVIGDSAVDICMRYADGEVEKLKLSDTNNEYEFVYWMDSFFQIRAKSQFELYIDGMYFGSSSQKKISVKVNDNVTSKLYVFDGTGEPYLKPGTHQVTLVYKNKYYEIGEIELEKRKYSDFTAVSSFKYFDGGTGGNRFGYALFNPILGIGSFSQGDVAGGFTVLLGEALGVSAVYLGYDLQRKWIETTIEREIPIDAIDNTIPKAMIVGGVGVTAATLVYACLIRPYVFKKSIPKDKRFNPEEMDKSQVHIGAFINADKSVTLCALVRF